MLDEPENFARHKHVSLFWPSLSDSRKKVLWYLHLDVLAKSGVYLIKKFCCKYLQTKLKCFVAKDGNVHDRETQQLTDISATNL